MSLNVDVIIKTIRF